MPTKQVTVTVGTTPVLVLASNTQRVAWRVTFPSAGIIAGNTGLVFIGRNFPPSNVLGAPVQGDVINNGGEQREVKAWEKDRIFQGDLWLIASIAAQIVNVEEDLDL